MATPSTTRPAIGLLINQIEGRYQTLLRRGLSDFCDERGLALRLFVGRSLASPYGSEDDENPIYGLARPGRRGERLDGLVVTAGSIGTFLTPGAVAAFLDAFQPLPLVTIGMKVGGYAGVVCDNALGITELVTHLVREHGHRRLAFLAGPAHSPDAAGRRQAFEAALRAAGLDPDPRLLLQGDFTYRSSEQLAAALDLSAGLPFDAVVGSNDDMALGFLEALERRGFRCPRDFALTGFDDVPDAGFASPALTTVRQPLYQQAVAAGERLLALMAGDGPGPDAPVEPLPCATVIRRSCGCAEAPRVASRVHRAAEVGAAPAAPLREAVVAAAALELSLPVRTRDQVAEALSALAETILLDLRTFRDHPLFLQTLGEWLDLTVGWEDFSVDWHRILTLFHREVLRSVADLRTRGHVDDLLQAGFSLLTRKAGERDARELGALRGVMRVLRDLSSRLATVPDVDGLAQVLGEVAPLAGLSQLVLYLHRDGPVPLGGQGTDPLGGELTPRVCLARGAGREQVLMPLVARHHAHGYVLLESPHLDALTFDTVRDQISQTLGALHLSEERRRAEEALKRSEERFRELASAVPMMVIETDADLNVSYINPAGREGLGLGLGAGEGGASLRPHLSSEDGALARDLVRRIGQLRVLNYPGLRLVNRAGRRYVPVVQLSGLFDAAGALTGIRWNALDPLPLLASGMLPDPAFFTERKITGREREVIELLLQGFRIRDMADRLSIAESTVKGHLTQVYDKLGINGRGELLQLIQEEQVRRRGFSAYVFGLVSRLLSGDGEAEPTAGLEAARQR